MLRHLNLKAGGGAFACAHTQTLAACWRPRLLRQSTAADRGRGPSRWRSRLSSDVGRLQPARRSAHAPQARVLRHLSRESLRWCVRVCAHANAGCLSEAAAGASEHSRAPSERAVSLAQRIFQRREQTPTSVAQRARRNHVRCVTSLSRESTRWRVRVCAHAHARCLSEAAAATPEHGRE